MKPLLLKVWKHIVPERLKCHISRGLTHRFNVGLVGCFFDREGRVLLFHHTYRTTPWGVPTGWLERAEQPEEGLLREIREESGLQVEVAGVHKVDVDRSRVDVILVGRFLGGSFRASQEVDNWGLFCITALPEGLHRPQRAIILDAWQKWHTHLYN